MVEVARRLGVTPSAVSRWESAEREADGATLARWAAVLGCAIEVRLVPLDGGDIAAPDGGDIAAPILAAEPAAILTPTTIAAELPALDAEAAEAVLTLIRSLARRPT